MIEKTDLNQHLIKTLGNNVYLNTIILDSVMINLNLNYHDEKTIYFCSKKKQAADLLNIYQIVALFELMFIYSLLQFVRETIIKSFLHYNVCSE